MADDQRGCSGVLALGCLATLLFAACGKPASREQCAMIPGAGLTAAQCAQAGALALPASLPPARGNAHADDVQAATFGHRVFFDARFSGNLNVRCATCHQTERSFQDDAPTPPGFTLSRNTPSIINAARLSYQFWDGRADSLWSQALIPFENPAEMNFSRLEIAHLIDSTFRTRYEPVFGTLPDFTDLQRFPASGAPGSPGFDGMSAADQDLINRVAANVGKAVEAYERRVAAGPSRLDAWLAGDKTALTTQEVSGLAVAARAGCLSCHSGPMLTDERYDNLGVPDPARCRAGSGARAGPRHRTREPI